MRPRRIFSLALGEGANESRVGDVDIKELKGEDGMMLFFNVRVMIWAIIPLLLELLGTI